MPEIISLEEWPAREGPPQRQEKYAYDGWFDGQARRFTRGIDFECSSKSFGTAVYGAARRRGIKIMSRRVGDHYYMAVLPSETA